MFSYKSISLLMVLPSLLLGSWGLGVYDLTRPPVQTFQVTPGASPAQVARAHIVDSAAANAVSITSVVCQTIVQNEVHAVVDCKVRSSQGPAHLILDEVQSTWHLTSSEFS